MYYEMTGLTMEERDWNDNTGGVLHVERWSDGKPLLDAREGPVVLSSEQWAEVVKFVETGE